MRHLVKQAGLESQFELDSAGTGGYHVGEPPDQRARAAGKRRGVVISGSARQISAKDFDHFDYLLAMDSQNLRDLQRVTPHGARAELRLLRAFDPASEAEAPVPDPYYGGQEGFDEVFDICEAACNGLLRELRESGKLRGG